VSKRRSAMAEQHDKDFDEFLAIRKPGAHLEEEVVPDAFVIQLGVDLHNYHKFSRVDDNVTYPKTTLDIRQELDSDSGAELPDYSGPYRADLRFTDFSKDALEKKFRRGARRTCSSVSTAGRARSRSVMARTRWPRSSGQHGTAKSSPSSSG